MPTIDELLRGIDPSRGEVISPEEGPLLGAPTAGPSGAQPGSGSGQAGGGADLSTILTAIGRGLSILGAGAGDVQQSLRGEGFGTRALKFQESFERSDARKESAKFGREKFETQKAQFEKELKLKKERIDIQRKELLETRRDRTITRATSFINLLKPDDPRRSLLIDAVGALTFELTPEQQLAFKQLPVDTRADSIKNIQAIKSATTIKDVEEQADFSRQWAQQNLPPDQLGFAEQQTSKAVEERRKQILAEQKAPKVSLSQGIKDELFSEGVTDLSKATPEQVKAAQDRVFEKKRQLSAQQGSAVATEKERIRKSRPAPAGLFRVTQVPGKKTVGSFEDAGFDLRPFEDSQFRRDFNSRLNATKKVGAITNSLLKRITKRPEALGFAGGAAATASGVVTETKNILRLVFGDTLPSGISKMLNAMTPQDAQEWVDNFKAVGVENQNIQSELVALAIAAAEADGFSGRAATDRKIQLMMEQLGAGGVASPATIEDVLTTFANRQEGNFQEYLQNELVSDPDKARLKPIIQIGPQQKTKKRRGVRILKDVRIE